MDLLELGEPFPADDIEWRVQRSGLNGAKPWGMVLAYVTSRAIMDRLDDVVGPENWKNEFIKGPDGGILCGISIKCGDEWVTKWDGAENTQVEAIKGGLSSAMKRAGVQWKIGRYLYKLDATWAAFTDDKKAKHKSKIEGKYYSWNAPVMPSWALPQTHASRLPPSETLKNGGGQILGDGSGCGEVVDDFITGEQREKLETLGMDANLDADKYTRFLNYVDADSIETIKQSKYAMASSALALAVIARQKREAAKNDNS